MKFYPFDFNYPFMIREIIFSSQGAYQVHLFDDIEGLEMSVLVVLDENNQVIDTLCPCREHELKLECVHSKQALKGIYNHFNHPLHERFKKSLWYQLGRIALEKIGFDPESIIIYSYSHYEAYSINDKKIFSLTVKDKAFEPYFYEMIFQRVKETEENSIKFLQFSSEEITLWREGRPGLLLRYELSFWSDFAKLCLKLQEESNDYKIDFNYSSSGIIKDIKVAFKEFSFEITLSLLDQISIIPSLSFVESSLKVFVEEVASILSIEYDEKERKFKIIRNSTSLPIDNPFEQEFLNTIDIGPYKYIPYKGFYLKREDDLLLKDEILREDIEDFLVKHKSVLDLFLTNVKLHKEPVSLQYKLEFDEYDHLHVNAYLFEIGDLKREGSTIFGSYVYLEEDGFYKIEEFVFKNISFMVKNSEVSWFVSQNRIWLNFQEGFATHLSSLEVVLSYQIQEDDSLIFKAVSHHIHNLQGAKDFGDWIYVPTEGFWAKHYNISGLSIKPNDPIPSSQISYFIHMHQEDLHLVKGFFASSCPLQDIKLSIYLKEDKTLLIKPIFYLNVGYNKGQLKFFGDFIFVENEGFSFIPSHLKLIEKYKDQKIISSSKVDSFITHELEDLRNFIEYEDPKIKENKNFSLVLNELKKDVNGLWNLKLFYGTSSVYLQLNDLLEEKKKGKRYLFTSSGRIDLQDKSIESLLNLHGVSLNQETLLLNTIDVLKLKLFENIDTNLSRDDNQSWQSLSAFENGDALDLKYLKSSLRPYQETCIKWLWFLYSEHLSGLLCDDMGLGKTHQAMALIAAISAKNNSAKFLVICPTSVIFHWQDKLKKYLPGLRVYTLYGNKRNLDDFKENFDVVLTSYGILRSELVHLKHFYFDLAVFDEAQVAKNHLSQTHKALLHLNARMKLGLTGTPIENRLRELKALFDLVLPGYMPSEEKFRDRFISPIEKENCKTARDNLYKIIKPFVLRRKKNEVLLELPEKVEEVVMAEFSEDQQKLYLDLIDQSKTGFIANDKTGSLRVSITLFSLLLKLKQILDHPAVFYKTPFDYKKYSSGKWELFQELIEKAMLSEQKVVVFSQYLDMLKIMELYLQEKAINYALIKGDTINRQYELTRFEQDPSCMVFLGSLQAVGLGVELTSASIVIHYDRWWNPARENQATDRVYRMGQMRGVQVFKLVTKGSIEESIHALIEKKSKLMEDVIGIDEEGILKNITPHEWLEILNLKNTF